MPLAVGAYGGQILALSQRLKAPVLYKSLPERYKSGNNRSFEIDKHPSSMLRPIRFHIDLPSMNFGSCPCESKRYILALSW
jgi:hypothetical protein